MNHRNALILLQLLLAKLSAAVLVNRTIDDQKGDSESGLLPIYTPAQIWTQGSLCTTCNANPDPAFAFDGTWHDTTYLTSETVPCTVSVSFNGTAVYAFFIIGNVVPDALTVTNLTITLDGNHVGNYVHTPNISDSAPWEYNVSVYSNTQMSNSQHTLIMSTAPGVDSLVLFDYVAYSIDPNAPIVSSSSSSHHSNSGAIIGGVVGGVCVVIIILIGLLIAQRRRKAKTPVNIDGDEPKPNTLTGAYLQSTPFQPYHALNDGTTVLESSTGLEPSYDALSSSSGPSSSAPNLVYGVEGAGRVTRNPPVPGSKAAQRQEELARQVREREQELASLQERQNSTVPTNAPDASSSSPTDDMVSQIERLQAEMQRLQTQQQQMMLEISDAVPPPVYS